MSNTLKGALAGGLTAVLLYMVLPSKVEVETIQKEIIERVTEVPRETYDVVRVRHIPYGYVGFLKRNIAPNSSLPLSDVNKEINGLAVYYPPLTYYNNQLVDQSGNQPIEICNQVLCGLTLAVGSALMLSIDNLNKIYIRNPSNNNVVVEVVYYER